MNTTLFSTWRLCCTVNTHPHFEFDAHYPTNANTYKSDVYQNIFRILTLTKMNTRRLYGTGGTFFFILSLGGQSFISSQSGCTAATPLTTDGPVPHPQPHRHNHRQHWQSSGHPAIDCRRFRACAASATAGASRYVTAAGKSFGFGNWVEGVSAMFRKLGFRVCLRDFKKLLCS